MGKATRAGASIAGEPVAEAGQEAEAAQETEAEDRVDEDTGEFVVSDEKSVAVEGEPPKRNASQPEWAQFAADHGVEGAGDMSRDELVAWWDDRSGGGE